MNRIVECPFCRTQRFVKISVKSGIKYKNIIIKRCINTKCKRIFMIPLNYKIIYLSRTFIISDTKYKYPIHVKNNFSGVLDFIDPLDFIDDSLLNHPETIVPFDTGLINKCDILVAFINQPTFGTLGELHYAKHKGMLVYVINHNRVYINDPWLKYIVNGLYTDINKCYYDLTNYAVKEYNMKYKEKNE